MSSRQRAWNAYEAAILLEGFLEIRSGTAPRKEVVARVSADLRELARRQGEVIDDIFRNIAGINSQLSSMESAFIGKTVSGKPATKLFTETVALYRGDRAAYDRLLKEAKAIMNRDQAAPLVRTGADERLRSKYPVIFKRVFAALQARDGNAGVSEIKTQIQDIGRASEIEEILDNASWSKPEGGRYRFSEEIQDHTVPSPAAPEPPQQAEPVPDPCFFDDADVFSLNFRGDHHLEFSAPVSISYFGEVHNNVSYWKQVYLVLLSALCRDYPERFHAPMTFSHSYSTRRFDLVDRADAGNLSTPEVIAGTNYAVETKFSAPTLVEKMKYLLDLCRVDYENVVIRYRPRHQSATRPIHTTGEAEPAHRAAASAPELYISDDAEVVKFGRKNQLEHTKPISLSYFGEVNVKVSSWRKVYTALLSALCRDYPERFHARMFFTERGNRYDLVQRSDRYLLFSPTFVDGTDYAVETNYNASVLIRKMTYVLDLCRVDYENVVIRYRRDDSHPVKTAKPRSVPEQMRLLPDMEPEQKARYCAVLQQYFENGFHLDSNMGLNRFQKCYQELFSEELKGSSEEILANIQSLCVVTEDSKAYLPECLLSEEWKEKILSSIARSFSNGAQCVYYQALNEEFHEDREFQNYPVCDNPDMLRDYLKAVCGGQYVFQSQYLAKDGAAVPDPKAEIRACLQEYGQPMPFEELCSALPQYPADRIQSHLSSSDAFISNGDKSYFLDSIVLVEDEEWDGIAEILEQGILQYGCITTDDLYEAVQQRLPDVLENNAWISKKGLCDTIRNHFRGTFDFKGKMISRAGENRSITDVFADFAKSRGSFTLGELEALAKDLDTQIRFDVVYQHSLRISREQFVPKAEAQFQIAETDAALARICPGAYTALPQIENFGILPGAGFPWNSFLLEQYAAFYSETFDLLHPCFQKTSCAGALVRRDAGFGSFHDLLVQVIADADVERKEAAVLRFLTEKGYLERKHYGKIDDLIEKARRREMG